MSSLETQPYLEDLPAEMLQMIFRMMPPWDLASCRSVCARWNHEISGDDFLMKKIWSTVSPARCNEKALDGNAEFIAAMVTFAKDKNPFDTFFVTSLHCAAERGHLDVCRLIIENVPDKNPADTRGRTPLHWASTNGYSAIVELIKRYL